MKINVFYFVSLLYKIEINLIFKQQYIKAYSVLSSIDISTRFKYTNSNTYIRVRLLNISL